ncbi:MAG: hypothetical protein MR283_06605 [Erysipelotrichaceae bacterium]|nr:hypothetical protein [Erysipelotrichaceae bacterium]MDY6035827.1 hypothetical protein [Bulleidia sp.]
MNQNDCIRIFLYFPIIEQEYECIVHRDITFVDLINQVIELKRSDLINRYTINETMIVMCDESGQYCSLVESLRILQVRDGMTFKVY